MESNKESGILLIRESEEWKQMGAREGVIEKERRWKKHGDAEDLCSSSSKLMLTTASEFD